MNGVRASGEELSEPAKRHPAVLTLVAVLLLETAALAAAAVYFVVELLVEKPTSVASAIGIVVLLVVGAIWVAFIAVGVLRGQAWTRAATVVVQVLVAAVAIGSFQGPSARPDLGVLLLAPAIAAVVLLFTKPVLASTTPREPDES